MKQKLTHQLSLWAVLVAALFLITGCPDRKQQSGVPAEDYLNPIEKNAFMQINDYRVSKGLAPLELDNRIVDQCRKHSDDMAKGSVPFGHDGYDQRMKATGVKHEASSENVAYNQGMEDPATDAVKGWIASKGHRQNIEGNYNLTGMGVVKNKSGEYYFTQIFLKGEASSDTSAPQAKKQATAAPSSQPSSQPQASPSKNNWQSWFNWFR